MSTYAEKIEQAAGEEILWAVVGRLGGQAEIFDEIYDNELESAEEEGIHDYMSIPRNVPLPWREARKYLDYTMRWERDTGSATVFYAWTATRVIFLEHYDGNYRFAFVPRNPRNAKPERFGGE